MIEFLEVLPQAAIQFPDIDPAAVRLPPFNLFGNEVELLIRWYALAYIAGLLIGVRVMTGLVRREAIWGPGQVRPTAAQVDDFLFGAVLGVILGGRLGYVLFYKPDMIWKDPLSVPAIWEGGMSFHGGLIGVALAIVWFARAQKVPLLTLGDLTAAAAPVGLFFGRIANFINAELYGRASDAPWAVRFPIKDASGATVAYTEPRHPSQLYEAVLEGLVLFIILRIAIQRFGALQKPGLTAGLFLLGYGVLRALVELVREPDAHMPEALRGFVTMGMLLCVPMILAGLWLIQRARTAKPA